MPMRYHAGMTDTKETSSDSEYKPTPAPFVSDYKIGDPITISRGRNAGRVGKIIARNDDDSTFVIQFPDGRFVVSGQANTKDPEDVQVKVSLLIDALNGCPDSNATQRVLNALESVVPGICESVRLEGHENV